MKGTITLKIIAAPDTETAVLIEKMDAEMPITECSILNDIVLNITNTINGLNGYGNN